MESKFDYHAIKAIPIHEVVMRFADLHREGSQYVTLCPNHADHKPSLYLNEKSGNNYCKCFSCGWGGSAIDYVIKVNNCTIVEACQWLSHEFSISSGNGGYANARNLISKPLVEQPAEQKLFTYVPMSIVAPTITVGNTFSRCVEQLFGYETARQVTSLYQLGAIGYGPNADDTIFWTIDEQGRVRNGKVQRYCTDIHSPRFAHCQPLFVGDNRRSYWLTNWLRRNRDIPNDAEFDVDCLYGAHLLKNRTDARVKVVESPKNAILGSIAYPDCVWVATGNKSAFRPELFACLRGREVIAIPDRDAICDWKRSVVAWHAKGLVAQMGIKSLTVDDRCDRVAPDNQPKYDIGDYIIDSMLNLISH